MTDSFGNADFHKKVWVAYTAILYLVPGSEFFWSTINNTWDGWALLWALVQMVCKFTINQLDAWQVKNGDLNWMVPGKLVAFSGPSARRLEVLVQN
jgi:hypothetical protein